MGQVGFSIDLLVWTCQTILRNIGRWRINPDEATAQPPGESKAGSGGRARLLAILALLVIWPGRSSVLAGEPQAPAGPEIMFGCSTALTGPASELGVGMTAGITAALAEANRHGGLRGRPLRLVALDDGYEPARTGPNMRKLVSDPRVVAIVGNVGTPTAVAAVPIAIESGTPFYGAFSGAGVLRRSPPEHYVVNYRASYAEETGAMVDALLGAGKLRASEIAFFTQRDAYGDAGFSGGVAALKLHQIADEESIPHVRYERNTMAVERAVADLLLLKDPPRAVIMVGAYRPSAKFIRLARRNGLDALFLNVSFVGAEPLARDLGADGEGVVITQTVPHYDADLPICRAYRQALTQMGNDASPAFASMEGYVSTRLLLEALGRSAGPVTRQRVVAALEGLGKVDLGMGTDLALTPDDHQACHAVWPTVVHDGRVIPLRWEQLPNLAEATRGR